MFTNHRNQKGFTLVELLIVVIILGILAAVVIPQFNTAAQESKEAALASNLATIRQAIEMYKVQHDDAYPTGVDVTFQDQLTQSTDVLGDTAGSDYGPYLRNGLPKNPINSLDTVSFVAGPVAGPADDTTGWFYSDVTGEFKANSSGSTGSGVPYFDL